MDFRPSGISRLVRRLGRTWTARCCKDEHAITVRLQHRGSLAAGHLRDGARNWFAGYTFLLALVPLAVAGEIPDPKQTPGVSRQLTLEQICHTVWHLDRRHVSDVMKRRAFANYRLTGNDDESQGCKQNRGRRYEVDHLVPRCAGGADEPANLWPQCWSGKWNASDKDALEVKVCKLLCNGNMTLQQAHELFRSDWRKAYQELIGEKKK